MASAAMLTAAPVMAAPVATSAPTSVTGNPAASLSVSNTLRAGSKTQHDSEFAFLLGLLIFVVVSVSITAAAGGFSSSK